MRRTHDYAPHDTARGFAAFSIVSGTVKHGGKITVSIAPWSSVPDRHRQGRPG
jgi:hypothetical protein